ncbi:alpha/beta hydrolase [Pendulispora brunnea]|uniref:Alpha/beta hydrolase n=1 Tax=Pendulispora brunnea TaxID=2905690 RepID=A0ABZ2K9F3_9BACT
MAEELGAVCATLKKGPHDVIDVGHSRIAHWRFGRGPDLLFVHGWPLHAATFRHLVPRLAARFSCHLIDLPGTGHTTSESNPPIGLMEHAETVRRVVDKLGLSRFAYVAHDSGGSAVRLAAKGDARVAGMVLGNTEIPGHHPWLIETAMKGLRIVPGALRLYGACLRMEWFRNSMCAFGSFFTDPRSIEGEFREWFVQPMLDAHPVLEGQMRLLQRFDPRVVDDLAEVHRHLEAPTLLIWGSRDTLFPLAKAKVMADQFRGGAQLKVLPDAGLLGHEDRAEEFLGHAEPFLSSCFERRRTEQLAS